MGRSAEEILEAARDDDQYASSLAKQQYDAVTGPMREELREMAGPEGRGAQLRRLAQLLALAVPAGTECSVEGVTYAVREWKFGPYRYRILLQDGKAAGDLGDGVASLAGLHRFGEHCDALVDAFTARAVKAANQELRRPALALLTLLGQPVPDPVIAPSGPDCVANTVSQALADLGWQSDTADPYYPPDGNTLQIMGFLSEIEKIMCGTSTIQKHFAFPLGYLRESTAHSSTLRIPCLADELGELRKRFRQCGSTPVTLPSTVPEEQFNARLEQRVAMLARVNAVGEQNRSLVQRALGELETQLRGSGQLPVKQTTTHGELIVEMTGEAMCVRLGRAVVAGPVRGWRQRRATTAELATCLFLLQDAAVGCSLAAAEHSTRQNAAQLASGTILKDTHLRLG